MASHRSFIRWIHRAVRWERYAESRHPPTPVASFGISYAGSNPHGPDENIRLDDFLQSIKFIGRVIHRLGEGKTRSSGSARISGVHEKAAALSQVTRKTQLRREVSHVPMTSWDPWRDVDLRVRPADIDYQFTCPSEERDQT